MKRVYIIVSIVIFWVTLSSLQLDAQDFIEVSESAGINHAFKVDLATFGGGAAVLDLDNDGWEDVFIAGGNAPDVLYRNNGDGTFTDIYLSAGLDATMPVHTQGACAADVNRDGYKDLLVTTMYFKDGRQLSPNYLFINNGDGTFNDATVEYGLDKFRSNSMGASFGDINADGYVDLYVANYFSTSPEGVSLFNDATITNSFAPAEDFFFINVSGRGFVEASDLYEISHFGFGFEGTFTDFDNDQDLDILVANDFGRKATPNVALVNDFPNKSLPNRANNLALNFGMNAMGIAVGDYNFDGYMDYFVSNVGPSLFVVNDGGEGFIEGSRFGLSVQLITSENYNGIPVSWGANFFDFDHDTDIDLFVANGALNPTIRPNHNFLFEQENGSFREVGEVRGLADPRVARGSVVFDYDNDGDLDLLVVNQEPRDPTMELPEARVLLYRNEVSSGNWLKVKLEGIKADNDGLGSRVEVLTDERLLIREIDGGSSHSSQSSTIAHFGLGSDELVEQITVKWVGGNAQVLDNVASNQFITIREDVRESEGADELELKIFPTYFVDEMIIEYQLPNDQSFDISIFDSQGRLIRTLLKSEGSLSRSGFWQWNVEDPLVHGVYIVQLRSGNEIVSEKAIKLP